MATKAQIARKMYGLSLSDLTSGEKAAVTRAYNAQESTTPTATTRSAGFASVKFGRPGVNGVKECLVKEGTKLSDALAQAGITLNQSKEGIVEKDSGDKLGLSDSVSDGSTYMIVPGVDSSC